MDRQQELEIIRRTEELFNDDASVTQIAEWYQKHVSDALNLTKKGPNGTRSASCRKSTARSPLLGLGRLNSRS